LKVPVRFVWISGPLSHIVSTSRNFSQGWTHRPQNDSYRLDIMRLKAVHINVENNIRRAVYL